MANLLNYKSSNLDMEVKEGKIPLIIKQKRFLEQLIEGNLDKVKELAALSGEERYGLAFEYLVGPKESKKYVDESSDDSKKSNFWTYLESIGLAPAYNLKDEPKDIRKRIIYLSLRGIREGVLQIAEIDRITDPGKIARQGSTYFIRKFMDPLDKEPIDVNEEIRRKIGINPIQEKIKQRLSEDQILRCYFINKDQYELFDAFCSSIAISIGHQYDGTFLE